MLTGFGTVNDPVAWDRLTPRQKLKYRNLRRWWYAPVYFMATYFWKRGFLDGRPGFIHAMFKFAYFFEIRAKILEAETVSLNSAIATITNQRSRA